LIAQSQQRTSLPREAKLRTAVETRVEHNIDLLHLMGADVGGWARDSRIAIRRLRDRR
jgi:hypothetical protein